MAAVAVVAVYGCGNILRQQLRIARRPPWTEPRSHDREAGAWRYASWFLFRVLPLGRENAAIFLALPSSRAGILVSYRPLAQQAFASPDGYSQTSRGLGKRAPRPGDTQGFRLEQPRERAACSTPPALPKMPPPDPKALHAALQKYAEASIQ